MKYTFTVLITTLLLFSTINLFGQTPFQCTGDFYLLRNVGFGQRALSELSVNINTNSVVFTAITGNVGANVSPIGYRSTDNFIYGVHSTQDRLYRIDANGNFL